MNELSTAVLYVVAAAAVIAATSFSGVLLTAKLFQNGYAKYQAVLLSFAAGVFIIAGGGVVLESLEIISPTETIFYFLGSVVFFHLLSLVWPEHHFHREELDDHCVDCKPRAGTARRMLIGDSVHNIVDGMLLVPAFMVGTEFGIFTVLAIWLHEIVQEISEFIVFKESGYSTRRALVLNGLSSLTIFVGVAIAFVAAELVHDLEGPLLAIAGGAFLYIALKDLVPHSVRHSRKHHKYATHVAAFLLGLLLMVATGQLAGHGHADEGVHIEGQEQHG